MTPSLAFSWLPWQPHPRVRAVQTWRGEGTGWGFNLADHVGAPAEDVQAARRHLMAALPGARRIHWLSQVHGVRALEVPCDGPLAEADAAWTDKAGEVCAVLTADCLPLLLADHAGTVVAAVHAGWRGLAAGVIESTVAALPCPPGQLHAWLGPRIGPQTFEIGSEVREQLLCEAVDTAAFAPSSRAGRWLADLGRLARHRLAALGVSTVTDEGGCTVSAPERWYSYRREGRCGRMATLIWLCPEGG